MKIIDHCICDDNGNRYTDVGGPFLYSEVKNFDRGLHFQFSEVNPLEYIVMHHTVSGSWKSSYDTFNIPGPDASSAHLIIDRDGTVIQCVPFNTFAWHCGGSQWADRGHRNGPGSLNNHSIGIELVNWGSDFIVQPEGGWKNPKRNLTLAQDDAIFTLSKHGYPRNGCGWQKFPEAQIEAAFTMTQALMITYPSILDIVGHEDIKVAWDIDDKQVFYNNDPDGDPLTDRQDPGPAFPLADIRARLLGLEAGKPEKFQAVMSHFKSPIPPPISPYRFLCKEPAIFGRKNKEVENSRPLQDNEIVEVVDRQWWFAKVRATNPDGTILEGWFPERYLKRLR